MSADQLLQGATQCLFVFIFIVVFINALRQPRRSTVDTALLFGAMALIIGESWALGALRLTATGVLAAATGALLMALPYLLLRLVDDFSAPPRWLMRGAATSLIMLIALLFVWPVGMPLALVFVYIAYFVALSVYVALAFVGAARRSSGVTKRRMQAVAAGTLSLGGVLLTTGLAAATPGLALFWTLLGHVLGLVCGVDFFIGFAPPPWLRRAWQEPEVRAFLGRAARLPRLPDTAAIVRELEHGAATSLGASVATIALWDEEAGLLRGKVGDKHYEQKAGVMAVGRTFVQQEPLFVSNAARADPEHAGRYEEFGAHTVLTAPITAGEKRLGVLVVYAAHAPIFAADDLVLVRLLADQAAVILESRTLIDEAARVRAREQATHLRDDFLSAAAHDLKTPLTALVGQAQLMEMRARRDPTAPPDLKGIQRMISETQRLKRLVLELLDVARVEQGRLVGAREQVDLTAVAAEVCARHNSERHRCTLAADGPLEGQFDPTRIEQLVENLVENAVKYSPEGGDVRVAVWREGGEACLTVTDQGIGIPTADLNHLFDRFHRGTNVDDRRFAGMGLGLYICGGIVQQHSGRIWATSGGVGQGSTFHVAVPLGAANADQTLMTTEYTEKVSGGQALPGKVTV